MTNSGPRLSEQNSAYRAAGRTVRFFDATSQRAALRGRSAVGASRACSASARRAFPSVSTFIVVHVFAPGERCARFLHSPIEVADDATRSSQRARLAGVVAAVSRLAWAWARAAETSASSALGFAARDDFLIGGLRAARSARVRGYRTRSSAPAGSRAGRPRRARSSGPARRRRARRARSRRRRPLAPLRSRSGPAAFLCREDRRRTQERGRVT